MTLSKIWQVAAAISFFVPVFLCAKVTIFMIGDSTMQDWDSGYFPKQGQGQDFHYFFDANFAFVVNRGQGGMAAEGYYDMFWKKGCSSGNCVLEKLQAGDYAIIQFGINDVSKSSTEGYVNSMTKMVNEARQKGAYPIISSPIKRCYYDSPTQIHNSYRQYPEESRKLAASLDVPFIDMDTLVSNFMISVGESYAEQFIFNFSSTDEYSNLKSSQTDQVHLQMNGANTFGRIITEQIRVHKDPMVKKLGDYMAKMYKVDVKVSPEGSAEATSLSSYYPEGMTVMLKTVPKNGKKFLGWYDALGNKVGASSKATVKSPYIYTFVMQNASTQYTAVYEGGSAQKYTGNGAALTEFPTSTPKNLDDVTFEPFTPINGNSEIEIKVDKNIVKYFDAYKPDSGNGFSENNWTGFLGEGFFNFANEKNSFASYKMNFPGAGNVTLAVIYANGGTTDRMFNAYMSHDYYISAPPTGAWDKWDTAYVVLDAPKGSVELKFMSLTADGAPNIDAFGFSLENVCRKNVDCKNSTEPLEQDSLKQNSTTESIVYNFEKLQNFDVKIFDMQGKFIAKINVNSVLNFDTIKSQIKTPGMYRAVILNSNRIYSKPFIIK